MTQLEVDRKSLECFEYSTPEGGWEFKTCRVKSGVWGNISRYDRHVNGWTDINNTFHWDHTPTHPNYVTDIAFILWQIYNGCIDVQADKIEAYLKYRVEFLTR